MNVIHSYTNVKLVALLSMIWVLSGIGPRHIYLSNLSIEKLDSEKGRKKVTSAEVVFY